MLCLLAFTFKHIQFFFLKDVDLKAFMNLTVPGQKQTNKKESYENYKQKMNNLYTFQIYEFRQKMC